MAVTMIADWRPPAPFRLALSPARQSGGVLSYSNARNLKTNLKGRAITARAKEITMMDLNTCAAKDCDKPRFLDYYVCAEHFAFYAAPQYTDSMLVKVDKLDPAPFPDFCLYPEAAPCVVTQQQSPPPDPTQSDATKRARIY